MQEKKEGLYSSYREEDYIHYRVVKTGVYDSEEVKSAKNGKRIKPILKNIKVSFEEVKALRLDSFSPAVPIGDTEDFTVMSNYLIDFWGAIIGSEAVSVYMHLRRYAYGKKDYCFPDIELIALKMNKSVNSVKKYMDVLEEYGFIAKFLRKDKTKNNKDVSPLFKIRRYIPMITREMYDSLPEKLRELHDDVMKELENVTFASNIVGTKNVIEPIVDNGEEINNKEVERKIEEVIRQGKLEEFVLNTISDENRSLNENLHEFFAKRISKPSYETWVKNTIIIDEVDKEGRLKLLVNNEFAKDWIQRKYFEMIIDWTKEERLYPINIELELINDYIKKNVNRSA